MGLKYKYIAIDFDGTIVDEAPYPKWGKIKPFAKEVMKGIKERGGQISIWTCRGGFQGERVKEFLIENNIPFDYFNKPFPELEEQFSDVLPSPKIWADIYIDDKSIHCNEINWVEIGRKLFINDSWKVGDKLKVKHYCGFEIGRILPITDELGDDFIIDGVASMDKTYCTLWFEKVSD